MGDLQRRTQKGWQVFIRRNATVEYITQRGVCIDLVRYDALCATCGVSFVGKVTKRGWRKRQLTRRCERHRRRGGPVNNDKPPIPVAKMPVWARPKAKPVSRTKQETSFADANRRRWPDLSFLD